MSIENKIYEIQVFRSQPQDFLFQTTESQTTTAILYGNITLGDESQIQFMKDTELGECPIVSGETASVTVGYHPIRSNDENDPVVLGIWNKDKCPGCRFNPVNPTYPDLVCKAALKPD